MATPKLDRRTALKTLGSGLASWTLADQLSSRLQAADAAAPTLSGKINHSVCKWCYPKQTVEELAQNAKCIGLQSIELLGPEDWPILKKHNLTCAMTQGAGYGITRGFNRLENHDGLVESYSAIIPKVAEFGFTNLICFSGNRNGLDDEQGIKNCAIGLKRLMPLAERHGVTLVMELLNSRVDHKDYQCDHTPWGVALCDAVGSERFKLLYDIYHMQIMEGDIIRTIRRYHSYIAHYHTGGVPGRHEIDDSQEIFYPAVMRAIVETGFKGHVAQEFIPARPDVIESLKQGVKICTV